MARLPGKILLLLGSGAEADTVGSPAGLLAFHQAAELVVHLKEVLAAREAAFDESLRVERKTMEEFLAELQKPRLPRYLPVSHPNQRPLLLSERTKLLLEIAGSYRLSAASELWYSDRADTSNPLGDHQS